jgi:altronate dehydratase small subunit
MRVQKAVIMDEKDNVATLLSGSEADDEVQILLRDRALTMKVREAMPFGHKFALKRIGRGEEIIKYGEVIGLATDNIEEGHLVHVHNTESLRGRGDLAK